MRGLSEAELDGIEAALEIELPDPFRALHANYPFPESSDARAHELMVIAPAIIEANQSLREEGFFGEPWPRHWFSFGCDGCGNEYYLRLDEKRPLVYFADHEDSSSQESGTPIEEGVEERLETIREIEAEERARSARKWWQFWR